MKFFTIILFLNFLFLPEKQYDKTYFLNGKMKAEGWVVNNVKTDYWYFYYENGKIKEEGRYEKGQKTDYWKCYNPNGTKKMEGRFQLNQPHAWWLFYANGKLSAKVEYSNGQKNGLTLLFKNGDLYKAEKYQQDKKLGEWTSYEAYQKDNP